MHDEVDVHEKYWRRDDHLWRTFDRYLSTAAQSSYHATMYASRRLGEIDPSCQATF